METLKMKILDSFLLRQLLGPFILGVFAFTTIFVGSDLLFRLAEYMVKFGISGWTALKVFLLSLPSIVILTFPMSMLLAVILAFSRLSANLETIALMSGGYSLKRLVLPAIILALSVTMVSLLLNEVVVPEANLARNRMTGKILGEKPMRTQRNLIVKDFERGQLSSLLYAREFDGNTLTLNGVTVQEFDEGTLSRVTKADRVVWSEEAWYFYDGAIYTFSKDGKVFPLQFKKQIMYLRQTPKTIAKEQKKPNEMNTRELREQIRIINEQGGDSLSLSVEMHSRWAIPFASVIFTLIGAPLGLQPKRGGTTGFSFGLSLTIIFVYYVLNTFGNALGQQGSLSPAIGAWMANIVIGSVGLALLVKANR